MSDNVHSLVARLRGPAVSVSGAWPSRAALITAISANAPDFVLGGEELYNKRSRFRLSLHSVARDCGFMLTCSSSEASLRGAKELQRAASALLRAGGDGVMVDSNGLTHSPENWLQLDQFGRTLDIYAAFVKFLVAEEMYGSCGMFNFGLPDVRIPAQVDLVEASRTISAFNLYVLIERPQLANGHTFCAAEDAPRFRLHRSERISSPADTQLFNPEGVWSLTLI